MNTLKKIVSYIFDLPVEKVQSRFSDEVVVSMHKGEYKLSTQNAIYSFGKQYSSFDIALKAINIREQPVQSILVLGFGLGSVVDLLENHPTINSITAVDADDIIIELAKKYLQSNLKKKTEYICKDAEKYVHNSTEKFDLILFDVFIDDKTPIPFMQADFLNALKKLINTNGILLFSKIDDSHKSRIENAQFEKNFSAVFPDSFTIDASGNKIFTWCNSNKI